MEPVKISFGFSKLTKKNNIIPPKIKQEEKKLELIDCLEGQSIKVRDVVEEIKQPLIIPLKDNEKNLLDRVRAAKNRDKQVDSKKQESEDTRSDSELTPDELAARQLIKEAKDRLANGYSSNIKVSVLPISQDAPTLEGEKEPTIEDYESVPISDYGLALLRGMGWKEGMAIGKNTSKSAVVGIPEMRPKGLGLGATKAIQSEIPSKKATDKDGNELTLVKGGFAKVIAGPHRSNYCEVQGFDEEAGRVIIKVYPKSEIVNINEMLLIPVSKEEFIKGSKTINNAKYEEYKEISDKKLDNFKVKSEQLHSGRIKKESRRSDSEEDTRTRRTKETVEKCRYRSESSESEYERNKMSKKFFREEAKSRTPTKSKRDCYRKDKTRERSRSADRSRNSSSQKRKKDRSSDEEYYGKDKKSKKHSKSKNRDRSRSKSRDKYKKSNKHSSRRDSSDSDSDHKNERRKKNKCKSRHRRNASSSSEDRRYKSKR